MNKLKFPLLVSKDSYYFTLDESNNQLCYNETDVIKSLIKHAEEIEGKITNLKIIGFNDGKINYTYTTEGDLEYGSVRWEYIEIVKIPSDLNKLLTL